MATLSPLEFYLIPLRPATVFSGRVNGTPSDPYMTVPYDAGNVQGDGPLAGNTVWFGTSSGGRQRGILRLRTASVPTGTAAGNLSVAESDDVGSTIADDDYITVKQEFRLWPVYPRIVQVSDTAVAYYEDYDVAWNNQTVQWKPVAVAGPPAVAFLEGGQATVSFVGDRSFALAPGATISGYLWTFYDGSGGTTTSSSQGTEAAPVTKTYTSAGQYLVSLRVTDSSGRTHTAYTWAFVVDPANPTAVAYTDFDGAGDSFDFEQGGGEINLTLHGAPAGAASAADFPEGTLVVLAVRGSLTTPTATWPFRGNVAFMGYVLEGSIRQDPNHGTVSFRAGTVDAVMRNTTCWPVSLSDKKGPRDWTMGYQLTVDRVLSFLWHWRSTLANVTPIVPLEYSARIFRQDFGPEDLWSLHQNLLKDAWARPVVNHQGVLHLAMDYQMMTDGEQAAVTERKLLHKGLWLDVLEIAERADYAWPTHQVKQSGVYYPGNEADVLPLFSEAPGDAPKAFGRESGGGSFILESQTNLNVRCGRSLAKETQRYPTLRARFVNEGSFQIAPQEIFPAVIEPGDNDRGLSWQPDLLPRRICRTYSHENGAIFLDVDFEPTTTGPAGDTVDMPVEPPPPIWPPWDPPPEPPIPPPVNSTAGPCVAADDGNGVYWSMDKGESWEPRNNGLSTAQLSFRDLIWDPWWMEKTGGHDPERVSLLGCGPGFVVRSFDAGKTWVDYTSYLPDPPNDWSDSPAPAAEELACVQIHGCIYNEDTFYLLAEWQESGGKWRGWLYKTTDGCYSWEVLSLYSYFSGGNIVVNGHFTDSCAGWSICEADGVYWEAGRLRMDRRALSNTYTQQTVTAVDGTYLVVGKFEDRNPIYTKTADVYVGGEYVLTWPDPETGIKTNTVALTAGTKTVRLDCPYQAGMTGLYGYFDDIGIYLIAAAVQARPLAMDVDTCDGSKLYLTAWFGGQINVQVIDTALLTLTSGYPLGPATAAEVGNRDLFAVPRAPHVPGTAGFDDYVYVFGRFDPTGSVKRLLYSDDAALSFEDVGDPGWGTGTARIGALEVFTDNQHILAVLNSDSPSLWETLNQGVAWSQINTVPFSVEFEALSKHWGEAMELLAGANAAGAVRAAWVATPWTAAWTDATGVPGLPDNEIVSIIWV